MGLGTAQQGERRVLVAASAATRVAVAREWLLQRSPTQPLCIVAPGLVAAARLMHGLPTGHRCFGWHRHTLDGWVELLSVRAMAAQGLAPARLVSERAVCARALQELGEQGALGRLTCVADRPGLVDALCDTLGELRSGGVQPQALAAQSPVLSRLLTRYAQVLGEAHLADRAERLRLARECVELGDHPWAGAPLLWLDVPLWQPAERALFEALAAASPCVLATCVAGDTETLTCLEAALGSLAVPADAAVRPPLADFHERLFAPSTQALDPAVGERVAWTAAAGEVREAVEIARQVRAEAKAGRRFDAMAVALRNVETYRGPLEEAFERAGVPAHFARGVRRPDPAGRSLLALLRCAREGLSARAFAEYLSLGQTRREPEVTARQPPPPDDEALAPEVSDEELLGALRAAPAANVPRRWERWLVESAVVGGLSRWQRRLAGLVRQLERECAASREEGAPPQEGLARQLREVEALRDYALPLLERLDELPVTAKWCEWLLALARLCEESLRAPAPVLSALAELSPLGPVGPVGLEEVLRVLEQRLGDGLVAEAGLGAGKVFVGSVEELMGMSFEVVFVPGLREKVFPRKELEDPLLLDALRASQSLPLPRMPERLARERTRLRVCVGAAERRLYLSYPRLDATQGRPRVPSLFALELMRVREGELLGLAELSQRATFGEASRLGWPAPTRPEAAIDDAEYDLSVLEKLLDRSPEQTRGEARYLVESHPVLRRALRFRALRWSASWSTADGLLAHPRDEETRALLKPSSLSQRPYAATALEHYAACPYRFYLHGVLGLRERPRLSPVESLGPLERGALFHSVQRSVLTELREAGELPLQHARLPEALERLDEWVTKLADALRDEIVPAIDHVFDDAVAALRADLRQWLTRLTDEREWLPRYFELGFGLPGRDGLDGHSRQAPVHVSGALLRGAIDLVEQRLDTGDGPTRLRATDHKTGADVGPFSTVRGGRTLQPLLYALALSELFPEADVEGGRLYFCTPKGGFHSREVRLGDGARRLARELLGHIEQAFAAGFFPAMPDRGACEHCAYRPVCGPYEERRAGEKRPVDALRGLHAIRGLR